MGRNMQFEHKGLHYGSGLTGFLCGILNRSNPPCKDISIAASKLLIPFEEYNPSNLPELLTYTCCKHSGKEAERYIDQVVTSVKTHLLPSNRYFWLEGIAHGLRKAGRENSEYVSLAMTTPREKHVTHEPSVKLQTGEQLTEEVVQLKICSVDSLLEFIQSVKSADYFRWLDLIKPFLNDMDVLQLGQLCDLLKPFSPANDVVSAIASAFVEIGEPERANLLISGLLGNSDAKGWDLDWDGGSKQSIFKTLVQMDAKKWRPIALQSLVDDYIGEYRYPSSLVWNLKGIVEIIFDDKDILPIWSEIKNHVYHLDDFLDTSEISPVLMDNNNSLNDASFLIQFAFDMLDVLIPELAHMAHQAIIGFAGEVKNRAGIIKEIKSRIYNIGLIQLKAMSLLCSLVDDHADLVLQFENEIALFCVSEDISVRLIALELANNLGIEANLPLESRLKLPFVYGLELPKINNENEVIPFSAMQPGETLPDVNDPVELLRPLIGEVKIISEMADIPFENIVHRASELMKSLVPENTWNKEAEEAYRQWMQAVGLELTSHRLRPQIAKLALSHVACELIDAGYISERGIQLLSPPFKRFDKILMASEPAIRPQMISVPEGNHREFSHRNDEWVKDINEAFPLFVNRSDDGAMVIGELTTWAWLDWDVPTEIRMSMVCHPEWPDVSNIESPSSFFPSLMHWHTSEYPRISNIDKPSLVIHGSGAYVDHGGMQWLALNPTVGFSLGWTVSLDGLFRWVDDKGQIKVESLYWKDGPIVRQPPKRDDTCSNGWLVTATLDAVNEIRNFTGETIKIDSVVRSYGRNTYDPTTVVAEQRNEW